MFFSRGAGTRVFRAFESYPMTMNSILGSAVYVAGELIIQVKSSYPAHKNNLYLALSKGINWKRVMQLGALGALENGVLMPIW